LLSGSTISVENGVQRMIFGDEIGRFDASYRKSLNLLLFVLPFDKYAIIAPRRRPRYDLDHQERWHAIYLQSQLLRECQKHSQRSTEIPKAAEGH